MKNALIIGYGFTAWSIDRALSRQGFEVYGLRRDWEGPSKVAYSAKKLTGNITEPETLERLSTPFDVVVNCVSAGDRGNTERYRKIYRDGSESLLRWARENGRPHVIYTGSSSVYGDRSGDWVDENSTPDITSPAIEVLRKTEQLYEEASDDGMETTVCRLTGIYGPGRHRVLSRYKQGRVKLRGKGRRHRNMIRREDIGRMIGILATSRRNHVYYNLTDSKPVQEKEFFKWLSSRMGREMPEITDADLRRSNKKVSNERFLNEFQYDLQYPTYREGYRGLI